MQARVTSVGLMIEPDSANSYIYPTHIDKSSLDALPSQPGIYIFRDENDLPLYIGKSINIRSRVLSHLRTPEEARMLRQSRYVEFQRTAGEIGALLRESSLIKQLQPLHNKKLRRAHEMCSFLLKKDENFIAPQIVSARDVDFASTENLYGLFGSRRAALETLQGIVDGAGLCPALTGLEKLTRGKPCFARQLKRCNGACIGEESLQAHFARLEHALDNMRVVAWPFHGAIGVVEQSGDWTQTHIIDHWFYLGCVDGVKNFSSIKQPRKPSFDIDTYKILVKPLLLGELTIQEVKLSGAAGKSPSRGIQKDRLSG